MNYTKSQMITMPIMLIGILGLSILLGFLLRNKTEKIKRIPIIIITSILIIMEIAKQIYYISTNNWTYWQLPFHFCSALMLWFALASYSKNKTIREIGYATSFAGSFVMNIAFFIYPSSIIGNACDNPFINFPTAHTYIFHFLSISIWMLIISLKLYKSNFKNILYSIAFYTIYFLFLIGMSYLFNTNYSNALYNNVDFLESIRINNGQIIYTLLLFLIGELSITASLLAYKFIFCRKKSNKKQH